MISRTGLALAAALLTFGAAEAQQAPTPGDAAAAAAPRAVRAAKKRAPARNATEIVLVNARQAVVTGAAITNAAGKQVASLKKPIEPGKRVSLKLPKGAGCTFAVNAAFSDDAEFDQTDVNLCADKTVRFVE